MSYLPLQQQYPARPVIGASPAEQLDAYYRLPSGYVYNQHWVDAPDKPAYYVKGADGAWAPVPVAAEKDIHWLLPDGGFGLVQPKDKDWVAAIQAWSEVGHQIYDKIQEGQWRVRPRFPNHLFLDPKTPQGPDTAKLGWVQEGQTLLGTNGHFVVPIAKKPKITGEDQAWTLTYDQVMDAVSLSPNAPHLSGEVVGIISPENRAVEESRGVALIQWDDHTYSIVDPRLLGICSAAAGCTTLLDAKYKIAASDEERSTIIHVAGPAGLAYPMPMRLSKTSLANDWHWIMKQVAETKKIQELAEARDAAKAAAKERKANPNLQLEDRWAKHLQDLEKQRVSVREAPSVGTRREFLDWIAESSTAEIRLSDWTGPKKAIPKMYFGRHAAGTSGIIYPSSSKVEAAYLLSLGVPLRDDNPDRRGHSEAALIAILPKSVQSKALTLADQRRSSQAHEPENTPMKTPTPSVDSLTVQKQPPLLDHPPRGADREILINSQTLWRSVRRRWTEAFAILGFAPTLIDPRFGYLDETTIEMSYECQRSTTAALQERSHGVRLRYHEGADVYAVQWFISSTNSAFEFVQGDLEDTHGIDLEVITEPFPQLFSYALRHWDRISSVYKPDPIRLPGQAKGVALHARMNNLLWRICQANRQVTNRIVDPLQVNNPPYETMWISPSTIGRNIKRLGVDSPTGAISFTQLYGDGGIDLHFVFPLYAEGFTADSVRTASVGIQQGIVRNGPGEELTQVWLRNFFEQRYDVALLKAFNLEDPKRREEEVKEEPDYSSSTTHQPVSPSMPEYAPERTLAQLIAHYLETTPAVPQAPPAVMQRLRTTPDDQHRPTMPIMGSVLPLRDLPFGHNVNEMHDQLIGLTLPHEHRLKALLAERGTTGAIERLILNAWIPELRSALENLEKRILSQAQVLAQETTIGSVHDMKRAGVSLENYIQKELEQVLKSDSTTMHWLAAHLTARALGTPDRWPDYTGPDAVPLAIGLAELIGNFQKPPAAEQAVNVDTKIRLLEAAGVVPVTPAELAAIQDTIIRYSGRYPTMAENLRTLDNPKGSDRTPKVAFLLDRVSNSTLLQAGVLEAYKMHFGSIKNISKSGSRSRSTPPAVPSSPPAPERHPVDTFLAHLEEAERLAGTRLTALQQLRALLAHAENGPTAREALTGLLRDIQSDEAVQARRARGREALHAAGIVNPDDEAVRAYWQGYIANRVLRQHDPGARMNDRSFAAGFSDMTTQWDAPVSSSPAQANGTFRVTPQTTYKEMAEASFAALRLLVTAPGQTGLLEASRALAENATKAVQQLGFGADVTAVYEPEALILTVLYRYGGALMAQWVEEHGGSKDNDRYAHRQFMEYIHSGGQIPAGSPPKTLPGFGPLPNPLETPQPTLSTPLGDMKNNLTPAEVTRLIRAITGSEPTVKVVKSEALRSRWEVTLRLDGPTPQRGHGDAPTRGAALGAALHSYMKGWLESCAAPYADRLGRLIRGEELTPVEAIEPGVTDDPISPAVVEAAAQSTPEDVGTPEYEADVDADEPEEPEFDGKSDSGTPVDPIVAPVVDPTAAPVFPSLSEYLIPADILIGLVQKSGPLPGRKGMRTSLNPDVAAYEVHGEGSIQAIQLLVKHFGWRPVTPKGAHYPWIQPPNNAPGLRFVKVPNIPMPTPETFERMAKAVYAYFQAHPEWLLVPTKDHKPVELRNRTTKEVALEGNSAFGHIAPPGVVYPYPWRYTRAHVERYSTTTHDLFGGTPPVTTEHESPQPTSFTLPTPVGRWHVAWKDNGTLLAENPPSKLIRYLNAAGQQPTEQPEQPEQPVKPATVAGTIQWETLSPSGVMTQFEVVLGAAGRRDTWNNLLVGKTSTHKGEGYGYSPAAHRWARQQRPAAWILDSVQAHGYGGHFGLNKESMGVGYHDGPSLEYGQAGRHLYALREIHGATGAQLSTAHAVVERAAQKQTVLVGVDRGVGSNIELIFRTATQHDIRAVIGPNGQVL